MSSRWKWHLALLVQLTVTPSRWKHFLALLVELTPILYRRKHNLALLVELVLVSSRWKSCDGTAGEADMAVFVFQDAELPLYLLRNVCFFCDSTGITSLKHCFEKATPENLPFLLAHILINLVANVRTCLHCLTRILIYLMTNMITSLCCHTFSAVLWSV